MRGIFLLLLFVGILSPVQALEIEVVGAGDHQTPIAIAPFAGEETLAQNISSIVSADLARSGLFALVDTGVKTPRDPYEMVYTDWTGMDALVMGRVDPQSHGRISVTFHLFDTIRKTELIERSFSGQREQFRMIAHRIADDVFEKITGDPGVFSSRIVFVNRQGSTNRLTIADSDGFGEKVILTANASIMSPAWSPDGSHIAYVSFEQGHAVVYVQSVLINMRAAEVSFPESNSAPAWSPDGRQLAVVLTDDGSSHIFLVRPDGSELQQLTYGDEIDTEPNFSPDGKSLVFTSDRGGSVQIYRMSVDGGEAERLTYEGTNNFSPRYSPDGKSIVFASWIEGKFYIATEDLESKRVQLLTEGGWERNPSFAPNGKLILFATEVNGSGVLSTVSIDGRVKQKITSQAGDILDPMWGPLVKQ